ncbi:MAG: cryptochrome/photolyase family protein [Bacteroidota bacterium]
MPDNQPVHVHWFRRDLRLTDHRALQRAIRSGLPVLPLFVFDRNILNRLESRTDRRVHFIHQRLKNLKAQLRAVGSDLVIKTGSPVEVWRELLSEWEVASASVVRDYEPYARSRDREVWEILNREGIQLHGFKDQVIFETSEIVTKAGDPYKVFTPYARQWNRHLQESDLEPCRVDLSSFLKMEEQSFPSLEELGFRPADDTPDTEPRPLPVGIMKKYGQTRDLPGLQGTTRLGVHLRFGTISIRELVRMARQYSTTFLNELVWREFFQMVLWHHPESVDRAIRPEYDRIEWEENRDHFQAWCEGRTGYPMVDAGMRELNETGFMHNRARMVAAGFLCKHLLIDWRRGERYFASRLTDFELASNVGNWQWAAGSGHDAAPWFRIFNPVRQQERFDPKFHYIKQFLPDYGTPSYPEPIIEHATARKRALDRYRRALT